MDLEIFLNGAKSVFITAFGLAAILTSVIFVSVMLEFAFTEIKTRIQNRGFGLPGKPFTKWLNKELRKGNSAANPCRWKYLTDTVNAPVSNEWVFQHTETGLRIEWNYRTEEARIIHPFTMTLPRRYAKMLSGIELFCRVYPALTRTNWADVVNHVIGVRELMRSQYPKTALRNALPEGEDYGWVREGNQFRIWHRGKDLPDEPQPHLGTLRQNRHTGGFDVMTVDGWVEVIPAIFQQTPEREPAVEESQPVEEIIPKDNLETPVWSGRFRSRELDFFGEE